MDITRRSLVIGLPVAASGLLTACGGGGSSPADQIAGSRSSENAIAAAAAVSNAVSGQISVTSDGSNFPSYLTTVLPSATLFQATLTSCNKAFIRGDTLSNDLTALSTEIVTEVNIDISHATPQGQPRVISLTLRKSGTWTEDSTPITFTAYNEAAYAATTPPTAPPSANVTGMTSHLQSPNAANQLDERYFHKFTSGKVKATRYPGGFLTLTFLSTVADALTATRMASTSANKATTTGTVKIMSTSARPSEITVKLFNEINAASA